MCWRRSLQACCRRPVPRGPGEGEGTFQTHMCSKYLLNASGSNTSCMTAEESSGVLQSSGAAGPRVSAIVICGYVCCLSQASKRLARQLVRADGGISRRAAGAKHRGWRGSEGGSCNAMLGPHAPERMGHARLFQTTNKLAGGCCGRIACRFLHAQRLLPHCEMQVGGGRRRQGPARGHRGGVGSCNRESAGSGARTAQRLRSRPHIGS